MNKTIGIALASAIILLSTSLVSLRVVAYPAGYPAVEMPTLMASLSPPNATIGDEVTWLVWTDLNCSGCDIHLRIFDMTNWTIIHEESEILGTLNGCGSLEKVISTSGYDEHLYQFTASMAVDSVEMNCSRYLEFGAAFFEIGAWVDPYLAVPGDILELGIYELNYPYVDASADIVVHNLTHPSLWTLTDVMIPSANGSRMIDIPTNGWIAGNYNVNVTATSSVGNDSSTSGFMLLDIIVEIDKYAYYVGEMVNVSIRTYPTVSQGGLQIISPFAFPPIIVVDEYVTLIDGEANKLYDSSSWTPESYLVNCNATIDMETVHSLPEFFDLEPFGVHVTCDDYRYLAGEAANINISTTPPQSGAEFNLTITNSTGASIWTYGPSNLDTNGEASLPFDTTGLPQDMYQVEVFVDNTQFVQSDYCHFEVIVPQFNIISDCEYENYGYTMPRLNITVDPQQENSDLTIEVTNMELYYTFSEKNLNISTYTYFIPVVGMPNGSYWVDIEVTSATGTNSTWCFFSYSNGIDTDGDGLSDHEEETAGTFPENPDSDGDGFFDGMEVFHGTNPLDPGSIIPEQILIQTLALLCASPLIYLIAKKKSKSPKY